MSPCRPVQIDLKITRTGVILVLSLQYEKTLYLSNRNVENNLPIRQTASNNDPWDAITAGRVEGHSECIPIRAHLLIINLTSDGKLGVIIAKTSQRLKCQAKPRKTTPSLFKLNMAEGEFSGSFKWAACRGKKVRIVDCKSLGARFLLTFVSHSLII